MQEVLRSNGVQANRRRRFNANEKRKFLEEAKQEGESLSTIGRRYDISAPLLFRWKRELEPANCKGGGKSLQVQLRDRLAQAEREYEVLLNENASLLREFERFRHNGPSLLEMTQPAVTNVSVVPHTPATTVR
jgi:transposase-like protein